jgi:dTDP-4-dehydrorhamnose reductase
VARRATAAGRHVTGTSSADLDITDRAAVLALVAARHPAVIVNTAADVTSWTVCADGAANVALAAARTGARLVHLSTDALHAGRDQPYGDDEPPTPVHPYGAAKAAAETAVAAVHPAAVLVRTSLILGPGSKHLTMALEMTTGRRPGVLFTDEYRCPIDVGDLAAAVLELAASDVAGVLNVAGPEPLSRVDLGRLVAAGNGLDPALVPTGTLADSGLAARPGRVVLDSSRAAELLTTRLRPASETLRFGG